MADEVTQEPTVESVPAAQEPSAAVVGETNQQVQAEPTVPTSDPQPEATQNDNTSEPIEDWNGNDVEKLPKPLQARARGMLRHLHKVSQEAASVKQQAQAYNEMVNHPEFQEFIKWKETQLNNSAPQQQEPLSEDEFLAAQVDPSKFVSLQQKLLQQQAAPVLQKLQQLESKINQYEQQKVRENAERELDSFARTHADFWDINPVIMKATLEDVVQRQGRSIEDAYNEAKSLEKQYLDKANGVLKQQIEAKKKAITATPSKSMEPQVIEVATKQERDRVAFENAKLGKRVDVRVKKSK